MRKSGVEAVIVMKGQKVQVFSLHASEMMKYIRSTGNGLYAQPPSNVAYGGIFLSTDSSEIH